MDYSKLDGLIPAVVQDAASAEVLMVGFMNELALAETRRTGFATFFSRSRPDWPPSSPAPVRWGLRCR